jgi:hypothetical protein
MPDHENYFPDFLGDVSLPSASPIDTHYEEVDISGETPEPGEPLQTEEEAKEYFNEVTEGEALNYLMMLHDVRAISFDRLNQLKEMLDDTPSFLPKDY